MKRFFLLNLFFVLFIIGCTPNHNEAEDPFLNQVFRDYPELKNQKYSVDSVERVIDGLSP
jgi:hypothetical protein